jgi:hypothetical protein
MLKVARILATAALFAAAHASAATYLFKATGTVQPFYTVNNKFESVPTPLSSINVGDTVRISFLLDTTGLQPDSVYDADPGINIYYARVQAFSFDIGAYHSRGSGSDAGYASVQLWNNYQVGGGGAVDLFSISAVRAIPSSTSPMELGPGVIDESFGFSAIDSTGTARSSDAIDDEPPLTAYGSLSGYFGFVNTGTYFQTVSSLSGLHASLHDVSAAPEPGSWALMIAGFALCGVRLRRRADDRSPAGAH